MRGRGRVEQRRMIVFVTISIVYFAALIAAFPLGRMIGRAFLLAGP